MKTTKRVFFLLRPSQAGGDEKKKIGGWICGCATLEDPLDFFFEYMSSVDWLSS